MSVTVTDPVAGPYTPNSVTTAFGFDFKAGSVGEVQVVQILNGVPSVISDALHDVALDSDEGGTVNFTAAPLTGTGSIYIVSVPDFTRTGDFSGHTPFNPASVNGEFDRALIRDIALQGQLDRVALAPVGDTMAGLPSKAARAGKFSAWDAGGDVVPASGTGNDAALRTDLADVGGYLLIGGLAKASSALTRTALAAIASPTAGAARYLGESGREGPFAWSSSNLSALVALDTQQGIYVPPASDTTGASGAWVRKYSGPIDIRWFGAQSGTAVGDQKPAIQCAINVAQSAEVLIPIGRWRLDSGLSSTTPMNLKGQGMGAGPGTVTNTNCSQILPNFASGDVIYVNSLYASRFEDFQVNSNVGVRTSGAGIHVSGDGLASTSASTSYISVAFNNQYEDIRDTRTVQGHIENTYHQAWATWAVIDETTGGYESGSGYLSGNYFFGDTAAGTTQLGCMKTRAGYGWVGPNVFIGGQVGWNLDISQHDVGFPNLNLCSFEEQDVICIYVTGSGGFAASMLTMLGPEFSVIGSRANFLACIKINSGTYTVESVDIISPRFRCSGTFNASFAHINLQNGNYVRIINPSITHLSGAVTAAIIGGGTLAGGEIEGLNVQVIAGSCGKYSGLGVMQIHDRQGVTFATLPSCANGSQVYCSDGTFANPVAGSGTGCFAKRLNGAWRGD